MKKLLLLTGLLVVAGLSGCSKTDDTTPDLGFVGGIWLFQAETLTSTPKYGGTTSTIIQPTAFGAYKLVFGSNGSVLYTSSTAQATGSYTYKDKVLTIPPYGPNGLNTQVLTVSELTTTKMVTLENTEDASTRYLATVTYLRR